MSHYSWPAEGRPRPKVPILGEAYTLHTFFQNAIKKYAGEVVEVEHIFSECNQKACSRDSTFCTHFLQNAIKKYAEGVGPIKGPGKAKGLMGME